MFDPYASPDEKRAALEWLEKRAKKKAKRGEAKKKRNSGS